MKQKIRRIKVIAIYNAILIFIKIKAKWPYQNAVVVFVKSPLCLNPRKAW